MCRACVHVHAHVHAHVTCAVHVAVHVHVHVPCPDQVGAHLHAVCALAAVIELGRELLLNLVKGGGRLRDEG